RATGANGAQAFRFGVLPQAMPLMATYSLLLFEHNVRSATILGLVGAGGVGFILQKYLSLFQYRELMGTLIFIIVMVTVIDRVSDALRKRLI
ncbi:ABC transporter permease subunit, partial [Candidatus Gracilibacteria bacterium]|nr:ABC transporter permease subunit [Candidatus Gracilibacteria bacterium]